MNGAEESAWISKAPDRGGSAAAVGAFWSGTRLLQAAYPYKTGHFDMIIVLKKLITRSSH